MHLKQHPVHTHDIGALSPKTDATISQIGINSTIMTPTTSKIGVSTDTTVKNTRRVTNIANIGILSRSMKTETQPQPILSIMFEAKFLASDVSAYESSDKEVEELS